MISDTAKELKAYVEYSPILLISITKFNQKMIKSYPQYILQKKYLSMNEIVNYEMQTSF